MLGCVDEGSVRINGADGVTGVADPTACTLGRAVGTRREADSIVARSVFWVADGDARTGGEERGVRSTHSTADRNE